MHPLIFHNDRLLAAGRARLPAITSATLHGRGVFTTLAVYGGAPFLWPAHWARLSAHAERAGVSLQGFDEPAVGAALGRVIEANKVLRGRARVTFLARALRGPWELQRTKNEPATDLLIVSGEERPVSQSAFALTISPYRTNTHSPLSGVKSVNYLEHLLCLEEARARDFDEAVVLNERGEITSAAMANIFWVKGGTLHTPALATGALAGTTRARVIELAGEMAVPLVEGAPDLAQLADADEIFLTSSGLGLAVVTTFDFHRYAVAIGSVAVRLHEAFRQLTLG